MWGSVVSAGELIRWLSLNVTYSTCCRGYSNTKQVCWISSELGDSIFFPNTDTSLSGNCSQGSNSKRFTRNALDALNADEENLGDDVAGNKAVWLSFSCDCQSCDNVTYKLKSDYSCWSIHQCKGLYPDCSWYILIRLLAQAYMADSNQFAPIPNSFKILSWCYCFQTDFPSPQIDYHIWNLSTDLQQLLIQL